jgi:D-glycero-D-manno-heptose 1,7-bisphosphate phosphatase
VKGSPTADAAPQPAVFFDRDGVLNVDRGYPHRAADLEWIAGARRAVRLCNDAGFWVFVVSNQSGVARGLYDEAAVEAFHAAMRRDLAEEDARIDDFRFCPHHPEAVVAAYRKACPYRKPAPGMLLDLMAAWPVDRARSFLVGDKESDLAAARAAGIAAHLYALGPLDAFIEPLLRAAEAAGAAP